MIKLTRESAEKLLEKHWSTECNKSELKSLLGLLRRTGAHKVVLKQELGMDVEVTQ